MAKAARTLQVIGQSLPERADAAANRAKILSAARDLVADQGVSKLSMDEVAATAGVGVGTVYRRFTDRAGLAHALLDNAEREFQEAFLSGPPPLGPDAPARERLTAFLHALIDRTEEQQELLLFAEMSAPNARFTGSYGLYRQHLSVLLAQLRPGTDHEFLADALLAPLAADLFVWQRQTGMSVARVKAGLDLLITGVASGVA